MKYTETEIQFILENHSKRTLLEIANTLGRLPESLSFKCRSMGLMKTRTPDMTGLRYRYPSTYQTWRAMLNRCLNPNSDNFEYYGGRGITICSRWQESFRNFFSDMGERPSGMTLDRINPDGGYLKENCRWADIFTQRRNRRVYVHE